MTDLTLATTADPPVYTELSAPDLAKLINEEYSQVLWAERTKLQRAKAIGEKLVAFRAGIQHGEWQRKLQKWCPLISYETANRYVKVFERWPDIEKAAVAKSVKLTDLNIDTALKLLAKPKANNGSGGKTGTKTTNGGVDPPATKTSEDVGKEWLRSLAVDDLVTWQGNPPD
jgi:hypothetical protein